MPPRRSLDVTQELLEAFDHSGRVTEYLVGALPDDVWRQKPASGRGRTIAAIVCHIGSVSRTFAKMGGGPSLPPMDRITISRADAIAGLQKIHALLLGMFQRSLARNEVKVKGMPRRSVNMMIYLIQHHAHHRGQITTLARDLGHEFTSSDTMYVWGWKKLP